MSCVSLQAIMHLGQFDAVSKEKQTRQSSIKEISIEEILYHSHNFFIGCDCLNLGKGISQ